MPPPPCHPQSGPSQSGDLETRVAGDVVVSAKTPSPPNGKDPQLDLRNSPRGPSPNLSPALALSPRFKAPGARPFLEGALRGGRSTTPPVWPLGGQDPGERRAFFFFFFSPPGEPPSPRALGDRLPGRLGSGGVGEARRGPHPPGCPLPASPNPGRSGPHSPSDAETPTAQGRRRCCGARRQRRPEGRAGGGGRDCQGDAPRRSPGAPPLGGVPVPPLSLQAGGGGSGALDSAPAPARERERDALTSLAPSRGSARRGRRTEISISSASRLR